MVTVHVEPSGLNIDVGTGQSVMEAAQGQGLFWPTACHGLAECQTCFFEVVRCEEHLEPPNQLEESALRLFAGRSWYRDRIVRLACQTRVHGPVTIRKTGVRPARWPHGPADERHLDRRP